MRRLIRSLCLRSTPPTQPVEFRARGLRWRLYRDRHIDRELISRGVFEPATTRRLESVVRPGMRVIDVGANFGYFTLLLARAVGSRGHVWAFEPARCYRDRLCEHLAMNDLADRVTVVPVGLSDADRQCWISVGECSATLHPIPGQGARNRELITLRRFDDWSREQSLGPVDLLKVDLDGHEPWFLVGAAEYLRRHRPLMCIEFFQGNLDAAGSDVRRQKQLLEELGYELLNERTGEPYGTRYEFLRDCGNFNYSRNAWARPAPSTPSPEATHPETPRWEPALAA